MWHYFGKIGKLHFRCLLLLFLIQSMNKQPKDQIGNFNIKLESCSDELSSLLDLIYRFPQQQRERYYDRIQLLKQNITQLKLCAKQPSTSPLGPSLQRKYQQLFMKLNQLKAEINACQVSIPGKKKKGLSSDTQPVFPQTFQINRIKAGRQAGKSDYDEIMETVVQKEEELKKYKCEVEQYKKVVTQYENRELETKIFCENLQKELVEMQRANSIQVTKAQTLQSKLEQITAVNQRLSSACEQYKANAAAMEQQLAKLVLLLDESTENCRLRKIQVESYVIQLAALEEKYCYDLKSHVQREDMLRMRQKNQQKKISQLQMQLEKLTEADSRNKELLAESTRLKEDIGVLETELTQKEQHFFEKNKKLQMLKAQLQTIKSLNSQLQKQIDKKVRNIEQLLTAQKQNQNTIFLQERMIRELQGQVAQQEQAKLCIEKKLRKLEQQLNELRQQLSEVRLELEKYKQQLRKSQNSQKKKDESLLKLTQEKQALEKQLEKSSLELAKTGTKIEQVGKILGRVEQEKMQLEVRCQSAEMEAKIQQENCKKSEKQIENLKKRLTRAKIEAIHNLRQIIV